MPAGDDTVACDVSCAALPGVAAPSRTTARRKRSWSATVLAVSPDSGCCRGDSDHMLLTNSPGRLAREDAWGPYSGLRCRAAAVRQHPAYAALPQDDRHSVNHPSGDADALEPSPAALGDLTCAPPVAAAASWQPVARPPPGGTCGGRGPGRRDGCGAAGRHAAGDELTSRRPVTPPRFELAPLAAAAASPSSAPASTRG